MSVKGYKVFRPDWSCSPNGNTKQYTCPGKFEEEGELDVCGQIWWDGLSEHEKMVIENLPNFDPKLFRQCTGIDVGETTVLQNIEARG